MYVYVWLFMSLYDYVWLCMAMYDYVWQWKRTSWAGSTTLEFVYLCLHLITLVYPCLPMFTFIYLCLSLFKWRIYAQISNLYKIQQWFGFWSGCWMSKPLYFDTKMNQWKGKQTQTADRYLIIFWGGFHILLDNFSILCNTCFSNLCSCSAWSRL